jgi:hypothetical protein
MNELNNVNLNQYYSFLAISQISSSNELQSQRDSHKINLDQVEKGEILIDEINNELEIAY